eukprot:1445505-Alexandrium_andersonii.AAC.1
MIVSVCRFAQAIFDSLPSHIKDGFEQAKNLPGGQARSATTKIINNVLKRDSRNKLVVSTDHPMFTEMLEHHNQKFLNAFQSGASRGVELFIHHTIRIEFEG